VTHALPRPEGALVLEADELDYDLAQLPLADGEYDAVVSAFAPMFSADPGAAIDELFRVVRPGGTVAFTAWTWPGIVGRLLTLAEQQQPLPAGAVSALRWGEDGLLREVLAAHSDDVQLRPGELMLAFASRDEAIDELFAAFRQLAWAPGQAELRESAEAMIDGLAGAEPGPVELRATYVMAVARRRSA